MALPDTAVDYVAHAARLAPKLNRWLRTVRFDPGQRSEATVGSTAATLLVARPLCHRIGLRHRTVQLILDHPTQRDLTVIQVRGLDKTEAPGAFDVPAAGHVVGLDTLPATLEKELAEELGLSMTNLVDLREVGDYEYRGLNIQPNYHNVEWRKVYRAQLRTEALATVRFTDGEVAALAFISPDALQGIAQRWPDRVASGLFGAMPWYAAQAAE